MRLTKKTEYLKDSQNFNESQKLKLKLKNLTSLKEKCIKYAMQKLKTHGFSKVN